MKLNQFTLEDEMREICDVRKEYDLPCRNCKFYEMCDGKGNLKRNEYGNNKEQNK